MNFTLILRKMNIRVIRKCLLIMLLGILPVSVGVGLIFAPMTLGYSVPVAFYVLPMLCILGGFISILFIKDLGIRKAYSKGILLSGLLWLTLCVCLVTIPFRFRFFFRQAVPGLTQFFLEREGKMIAHAVKGRYEYSDYGGHVSRITLEGWQSLDVGTGPVGQHLQLWGHFRNSFPLEDTLFVFERISDLISPFLNDSGMKILTRGKTNRNPIPGGFNISIFDTEASAITIDIRSRRILVLIEKKYTIL